MVVCWDITAGDCTLDGREAMDDVDMVLFIEVRRDVAKICTLFGRFAVDDVDVNVDKLLFVEERRDVDVDSLALFTRCCCCLTLALVAGPNIPPGWRSVVELFKNKAQTIRNTDDIDAKYEKKYKI